MCDIDCSQCLIPAFLRSERSSTRRHAPPGGKSSFSLSYDEPVAAAPKRTQQPVAAEAPKENQSVKVQPVAAPADSVPFRKVRQAPGGTSSLVIG
jgi:hypothetical protein